MSNNKPSIAIIVMICTKKKKIRFLARILRVSRVIIQPMTKVLDRCAHARRTPHPCVGGTYKSKTFLRFRHRGGLETLLPTDTVVQTFEISKASLNYELQFCIVWISFRFYFNFNYVTARAYMYRHILIVSEYSQRAKYLQVQTTIIKIYVCVEPVIL